MLTVDIVKCKIRIIVANIQSFFLLLRHFVILKYHIKVLLSNAVKLKVMI